MTPLKMLETQFKIAETLGFKYVGVLIEMPDFPKPEMIINPNENIEKKLDYYKKTYDEDLNHKHAERVRIVNFSIGNSLEEVEEDLMNI